MALGGSMDRCQDYLWPDFVSTSLNLRLAGGPWSARNFKGCNRDRATNAPSFTHPSFVSSSILWRHPISPCPRPYFSQPSSCQASILSVCHSFSHSYLLKFPSFNQSSLPSFPPLSFHSFTHSSSLSSLSSFSSQVLISSFPRLNPSSHFPSLSPPFPRSINLLSPGLPQPFPLSDLPSLIQPRPSPSKALFPSRLSLLLRGPTEPFLMLVVAFDGCVYTRLMSDLFFTPLLSSCCCLSLCLPVGLFVLPHVSLYACLCLYVCLRLSVFVSVSWSLVLTTSLSVSV